MRSVWLGTCAIRKPRGSSIHTISSEYNIKRHYTTKHSSQFDKILGQSRVDKIKHLKNPLKNSKVFYQLHEIYRTGYITEP